MKLLVHMLIALTVMSALFIPATASDALAKKKDPCAGLHKDAKRECKQAQKALKKQVVVPVAAASTLPQTTQQSVSVSQATTSHCNPKPTVTTLVEKKDTTRLVGHLFAKSNDADRNRLISVTFANDAGGSQISNVIATITNSDGSNRHNQTIQPGSKGGTFSLTLPNNVRELHFTIVKGQNSQSATVVMQVVDECHPANAPFQTFQGGGPAAFQP